MSVVSRKLDEKLDCRRIDVTRERGGGARRSKSKFERSGELPAGYPSSGHRKCTSVVQARCDMFWAIR